MNFKMKLHFLALAAVPLCCLACIETDSTLGGSLVPAVETYTFYTAEVPLEGISMKMADKLSGFSDSRITIGSIREDTYGLTTRASAFPLIPMIPRDGSFEIGANPVFKRFHFAAALDTTSFIGKDQENILQNVRVYELDAALDPVEDFDCNKPVKHGTTPISKGVPVYKGADSLTFDFSEEFGKKFLQLSKSDVKDMKSYLAKLPGIYLETDVPEGDGGRIDMFDVQLDYDPNYSSVIGNFATLNYSAEFGGVRKDTSIFFYYGATDFYNLDSLFKNYTGTFPQYALNVTGQQTRERVGEATGKILIEGGGGLKPVVSAISLKHQMEDAISAVGGNPKNAIINKATIIFPFEFPEDYKEMDFWPYRLSPTCRMIVGDDEDEEHTSFMGLTDSSSSNENQGDLDRSLLRYAPDITYHMQEILKIDESQKDKTGTKYLLKGNYDVWLLVMAEEILATVNTTSQETQEMLNYLAYSSYYNSMYGGYGGYGYGGYGGYGYGGYGGYGGYYSNYLNYAMMAQMASMSQTTYSTTVKLDKDRFYRAALNGPAANGPVPTLRLTFALPNEE